MRKALSSSRFSTDVSDMARTIPQVLSPFGTIEHHSEVIPKRPVMPPRGQHRMHHIPDRRRVFKDSTANQFVDQQIELKTKQVQRTQPQKGLGLLDMNIFQQCGSFTDFNLEPQPKLKVGQAGSFPRRNRIFSLVNGDKVGAYSQFSIDDQVRCFMGFLEDVSLQLRNIAHLKDIMENSQGSIFSALAGDSSNSASSEYFQRSLSRMGAKNLQELLIGNLKFPGINFSQGKQLLREFVYNLQKLQEIVDIYAQKCDHTVLEKIYNFICQNSMNSSTKSCLKTSFASKIGKIIDSHGSQELNFNQHHLYYFWPMMSQQITLFDFMAGLGLENNKDKLFASQLKQQGWKRLA